MQLALNIMSPTTVHCILVNTRSCLLSIGFTSKSRRKQTRL